MSSVASPDAGSTYDRTCQHDVIVIGAGVLGSALAAGLARSGRRVLLVERSLETPDRIVGELLQPAGCLALRQLGLQGCLDGIDARSVRGYCVFWGDADPVDIPYPRASVPMRWPEDGLRGTPSADVRHDGVQEGRSFHHGRFVDALRKAALNEPLATVLEATALNLVTCPESGRILGCRVAPKSTSDDAPIEVTHLAPLTVVADGCFSKFRRQLLPASAKPVVRSNFVSLLLRDAALPAPAHGHVILPKKEPSATTPLEQESGTGPILVYQLDARETRMLIDVPGAKVPSVANGDLQRFLQLHVGANLPTALRPSFDEALRNAGDPSDPSSRLRSMPNSWLPPHPQHHLPLLEGCLLAGDSFSMRHPLTGGGMTVALRDAVHLVERLGGPEQVGLIPARSPHAVLALDDWSTVTVVLRDWSRDRKPAASTINVLAQALYCLFGADDENLEVLKMGCFKYFELGGECVQGPVSLLSALGPSRTKLFYHFFSVALYSIYLLFAGTGNANKPSPMQWPQVARKGTSVFWTACLVFLPVLWKEF